MSMAYNLLGDKIIEQMKQTEEERRYLERITKELMKKAERLLEQGRLKRYHGKIYYIFYHYKGNSRFTEFIPVNSVPVIYFTK